MRKPAPTSPTRSKSPNCLPPSVRSTTRIFSAPLTSTTPSRTPTPPPKSYSANSAKKSQLSSWKYRMTSPSPKPSGNASRSKTRLKNPTEPGSSNSVTRLPTSAMWSNPRPPTGTTTAGVNMLNGPEKWWNEFAGRMKRWRSCLMSWLRSHAKHSPAQRCEV